MWPDREREHVRSSLKTNVGGQRGLLQRNLAQAHGHIQLPAGSGEADKVRPRLKGNNLQTGYGSYTLQPNKASQGFYDLALDGNDLGLVGTRRSAQALLARLHDEAMIRHRTSVRTAAMPAGAAFQASRGQARTPDSFSLPDAPLSWTKEKTGFNTIEYRAKGKLGSYTIRKNAGRFGGWEVLLRRPGDSSWSGERVGFVSSTMKKAQQDAVDYEKRNAPAG